MNDRPIHRAARCRVLLAFALASCVSYEPKPLDLAEHARRFAERLPDLQAVDALLAAQQAPARASGEALDLATARRLCLWTNAELRALRQDAAVAQGKAEFAGMLPDPSLQPSLYKILGNAPDSWLPAAAVGFSLPLVNEPRLREALAHEEHGRARLATLVREVAVQDELSVAWSRWSAAARRAELLEGLLQDLQGLEEIVLRLQAAGELQRDEARAFSIARLVREEELLTQHGMRERLLAECRRLLGLPPQSRLAMQPQLPQATRLPAVAAQQALLRTGPSLALARADHAVAERELELEIARQWPYLQVAPGFQREDGETRLGLGLNLTLPIWNRNRQAIAMQLARRDEAAALAEQAYEEAAAELALQLEQAAAARRRLELVEQRLLPLCRDQVEDLRRLVERGRIEPTRMLEALLLAHDARVRALDAALAGSEAQLRAEALFWPTDLQPLDVEDRP